MIDRSRGGHPPTRADEVLLYRIVDGVARATNTEPLDLPALSETVDVGALDRLYRTGNGDLETTFTFYGCTVAIDPDGTALVDPDATEDA